MAPDETGRSRFSRPTPHPALRSARDHPPRKGEGDGWGSRPATVDGTGDPARPSFRDRLYAWRDRLLASPSFHRWAARFPATRPIARRQARALFDICAGFVYAQILAACVQLKLFEILAEGPAGIADLSRRLALPPDATERLLVAAVSLGLVETRGGGRFGLGLLGAASLGNPGVAAMVTHHALLYADLADPVALLRRGGGGALSAYWPYAVPGAKLGTQEVAPYTGLMSASQPFVAEQVLDAYPLDRHRRLVDVGGGDGTFLAAASRRAPHLALVLFDLPAVAALAGTRFAREGIADRATAIGGSFLADPVPDGCDVASLIRVVHDHDDGPALAILQGVRKALPPGGTLLLAEPMAETSGRGPVGAYFSVYLAAMGSGRPRTRAELSGLLAAAGFRTVRHVETANPMLAGLLVANV